MGNSSSSPLIFPKEIDDKKNPFKIGKYTCLARLGHGAYGIVYRASSDDQPDQLFALKVQKAQNSSQIGDILKEINQHRSVSHPNLVQYFEALRGVRNKDGEERKVLCMVLEYVNGASLETILMDRPSLPPELKAKWSYQLISGIEYLHSLNKVHRDLKPANLLISRDSEDLKIGDFGLARDLDVDGQASTICGTPLYMAPEIQPGRGFRLYGPEVDIWSIGMILLRLVVEVPLTREINKAVMTANWETDIVKLLSSKKLPQPIWSLIYECLRYLPSDRIKARNLLDHPIVSAHSLALGLISEASEAEATLIKLLSSDDSVLTILMMLKYNLKSSVKKWILDEFCAGVNTFSVEVLFHSITTDVLNELSSSGDVDALKLKDLIEKRKRRSKMIKVEKTVKYPEKQVAKPGWYWRLIPTGSGGSSELRKFKMLPKDISEILYHFSSREDVRDVRDEPEGVIKTHSYQLIMKMGDQYFSFDIENMKIRNVENDSFYDLKEVKKEDTPTKNIEKKTPEKNFQYLYMEGVQWIDFPIHFQSVLNEVFNIPIIEAVALNTATKTNWVVSFNKMSCYHLTGGHETPIRYLM